MLPPLGLSVEEAITFLKPLVQFVFGMVVYSILIYHLYRFLAKRDVIVLDLSKRTDSRFQLINTLFKICVYIFENILFVPLFIFLWFAFLTIIISIMAKEQAAQAILLVSMALVATIRITAYYKESLSADLAKVLPFTLLVIFVTELSSFSATNFIATLSSIVTNWKPIVYYFLFVVALEFVLNFGYELFHIGKPKRI